MTRLITVEETARRLSVSRRYIYDLIAAGRLPTVKLGRRRLVSERALSEFLGKLEKEASDAGAC